MMSVRLRLAGVLAHWWLKERQLPPQPESRLAMRCWWTDCDINRHMNNSRYLAIMDVGRWHYILATGMAGGLKARGWFPVAVRVEIDYKQSIHPGERFELETDCEKVGTKSATLRQRFWLDGGVLAAEAKVIVLFLHKGKSQELAPLMADYPLAAPKPEPVLESAAP
ncbi:MAG: acyl-CoA thioesterase [Candidatus Sericytochromatia bacterium]